MMSWNIADIFLILIIVASMALGWRRGFWVGLLDLVVWIGSLLLGLAFYRFLAGWLSAAGLSEVWATPLAFILLVFLGGLGLARGGYALIQRAAPDEQKNPAIHVLGLLPGLVNGLIMAAVVAALFLTVPIPGKLGEDARSSELVRRAAGYTHQLETALSPVFGRAIAQTLTMLTVQPDSHEIIKLPYRAADAVPRPRLEAEMLDLVNQERARAKLPPLRPDPALTKVARRHSADMLARGYFAHISPEGKNPFDRLSEAGIIFLAAGENLALAPTLSLAHSGLMNSPEHRANILRPEFGRVGIGIMDGGALGLMVTQLFTN